MTIYNLGNIKGEKGDRGECAPGPTGPVGVGIKSIEQITHKKFKFCLTDGSEYIIDYDTGSFDGMVVVCDKSILSAADGEFATVSAQLTSGGFPVPFAGELITFEVRKQSDDSLVETLTDITDGTGKASVEYFGKGVGDLNIKVKCRSFIEIYEIEDCIRYNTTVYSSSVTTEWDLPTDFKVEFIINSTSGPDPNFAYLRFNDSNTLYCGKSASRNRNVVLFDESNILHTIPVSVDTKYVLTYDDGVATLTSGTDSITINQANVESIYSVNGSDNASIKNIKIKPL